MGSVNMPIETDAPLETDVLVVGGGPVGMFTALRLAKLGQSCVVVEQNTYTSIHPKMEYTSHRSMEIYRQVGLIDHLRPKGVPESYKFAEVFVTGLGGRNKTVARIDRPSPAELRKTWAESNDGSHPLEPHMRQTQTIYEAVLKSLVVKEPLIHSYWGYPFESLVENDDSVLSTIRDPSGNQILIKSRYVIGCDGAGSKVRESVGLVAPRRSLVSRSFLLSSLRFAYVHFKSKDLEKMRSQGDFWHLIILTGALVIAQDEVEIYTLSLPLPPGADMQIDDVEKLVNESIGGVDGPFDIKVDEVMVSGDAAHQLTPAGGHGLNSGIQDAYDLTWKLVAVLRGWGGDILLDSYNKERRPIAELNTSMVEKAVVEVVIPWTTKGHEIGLENRIKTTEEGQRKRDELRDVIMPGRWIHEQTGTVMGYRYNDSPIVITDPSIPEPPTSITEYIPSTWPGARAPHVFLADGRTSIFDLYGTNFSIVDFSAAGKTSEAFVAVANELNIPITRVHLPEEKHCRAVWERDVVLVRPDGFVAWRCSPEGPPSVDVADVKKVLLTVAGRFREIAP